MGEMLFSFVWIHRLTFCRFVSYLACLWDPVVAWCIMKIEIEGWEDLDKLAKFDFIEDLEKVLTSYSLHGNIRI